MFALAPKIQPEIEGFINDLSKFATFDDSYFENLLQRRDDCERIREIVRKITNNVIYNLVGFRRFSHELIELEELRIKLESHFESHLSDIRIEIVTIHHGIRPTDKTDAANPIERTNFYTSKIDNNCNCKHNLNCSEGKQKNCLKSFELAHSTSLLIVYTLISMII